MRRRLRVANQYGGPGPFTVPPDHVPAIRVPKGGSCCANCMFVDAARHECKEPHYIRWNGSPKLPDLPLDEICSDWYDWPGSGDSAGESGYYVWKINRHGEPSEGGAAGPFGLEDATAVAVRMAAQGWLDTVVSRESSPSSPTFAIVARYEARTGKEIL